MTEVGTAEAKVVFCRGAVTGNDCGTGRLQITAIAAANVPAMTIATTSRAVRNAYWDLAYANASLVVQQQSLDLANESLREHAIQRRNKVVRLNTHVKEATDHVDNVVRVNGREHEVASQC